MKYQAMSETVLKAVGGKENITSVTHCATRLRIDARDTSIIDLQLAKSADQALGAVVSGGQLQVIIGPNVTEAYNDFLDFAGIEVGGGTVADDAQTAKDLAEGIKSGNTAMGLIEKFGNVSAQVFMPIVPALIVGGLILSIKNLLVNYCGLSTDSGTAQVLLASVSASFSFLPGSLGDRKRDSACETVGITGNERVERRVLVQMGFRIAHHLLLPYRKTRLAGYSRSRGAWLLIRLRHFRGNRIDGGD